MTRDQFDLMIGRLDRILSDMIGQAKGGVDESDRQTLKHHAEDMVAAGTKILEILAKPKESSSL